MKSIAGYTDRSSVAPGQRIAFKVSVEDGTPSYRARLVRLISTDDQPNGPGLVERAVAADFEGSYLGRKQAIHTGSAVIVPRTPRQSRAGGLTAQAIVWPTTPGRGRQTIMGTWSAATEQGFALELDELGSLALRLDDETWSVDAAMLAREWYLVAACYDAGSGGVRLIQRPFTRHALTDDRREARLSGPRGWRDTGASELLIAAHHGAGEAPRAGHFNGKIARPRLAARALVDRDIEALAAYDVPARLRRSLIGAWDFVRETSSDRMVETSGQGRDGRAVNLPTRAMKNHAWSGRVHDWKLAPAEYDAIHFHDDDLHDAGWRDDFTYAVPKDLPSGVYAARLENGHDPEHVVFFVRPGRRQKKARVAFLASTATYMAYANFRVMNRSAEYEVFQGALLQVGPEDIFLNDRPQYGDSTYGLHSDGSGVSLSSRLRPIVNMRPNTPLWAFSGDMYALAWLDHLGEPVDVITDEDLHEEGYNLLKPYRVLVTGGHPEYISLAMWDAVETLTRRGGRLMYLGGNGFYWRIAFNAGFPGVIEVRRAEDGTRAWASEPGEYFMSLSGEYGGLWRRQDRTPNRLLGVGFTAQGFDVGGYYRRTAASREARAAFIFEGIGHDESIGDFGFAGGGAAGQELDRCDRALGSPPHALVVASSEGHTDNMLIANEELLGLHPKIGGTENPLVRSDLTFFELPGGGAVFSTGSISWVSSLAWNGFDNNVARLSTNVLKRFLDPAPFVLPIHGERG